MAHKVGWRWLGLRILMIGVVVAIEASLGGEGAFTVIALANHRTRKLV